MDLSKQIKCIFVIESTTVLNNVTSTELRQIGLMELFYGLNTDDDFGCIY